MLHAVIVASGLITIHKSLETGYWPSLAAALLMPDCLLNPVLPSFRGAISKLKGYTQNTCWNVFVNNVHL